jgi:hypothetical protein
MILGELLKGRRDQFVSAYTLPSFKRMESYERIGLWLGDDGRRGNRRD